MKVVPVPFSTEGKNMLIHTKELLEFEEPIIAINPRFEKLTTSLRTAISDEVENLVENLKQMWFQEYKSMPAFSD